MLAGAFVPYLLVQYPSSPVKLYDRSIHSHALSESVPAATIAGYYVTVCTSIYKKGHPVAAILTSVGSTRRSPLMLTMSAVVMMSLVVPLRNNSFMSLLDIQEFSSRLTIEDFFDASE